MVITTQEPDAMEKLRVWFAVGLKPPPAILMLEIVLSPSVREHEASVVRVQVPAFTALPIKVVAPTNKLLAAMESDFILKKKFRKWALRQ